MSLTATTLILEAGRTQLANVILTKRILWVAVEGTQHDIIYAPASGTRKAYHIPVTARLKFSEATDENREVYLLIKD